MKKSIMLAVFLAAVAVHGERLSGSGQQASRQFNLSAGLQVFSCDYQGSGYFGVTLLDGTGNYVELLANNVGRLKSSKAVGLSGGTYMLNVTADGYWAVDVSKPSLMSSRRSFDGKGPQATYIFELSTGLYKFQLKHTGTSNFQVQLLDENGQLEELLSNAVGSCEISKAVKVEQGKHILNVNADGQWSVEIKSP
jgi:hypothetical protein